ncbi:MAG: rod shape-determining protein MreC [Aquificae bacterium]|nr:rod shape-determining protein MreC [Aquificota bacterium]
MKKKFFIFFLAGALIVIGGTVLIRISPVKELALDVSAPVLKSVRAVKDFFSKGVELFSSKEKLSEENRELKRKVEILKTQLIYLKTVEKENRYLKQILNYVEKNKIVHFKVAKVIGYSPDSWNSFIIIGIGSKDGVKKGDVVVANGYLLGEVYQVGRWSSSVILTSDKNFRITGRCRKTGELVFYQGKSPGEGKLLYVKPEQDVRVGDIIETVGVNGDLPEGIPIGTVKSVSYREGEFYKKVSVSLPLNPLKVEYVVVILRKQEDKKE